MHAFSSVRQFKLAFKIGALSQKEFEAPTVDHDKCIKCGKCVRFCPMKALVLE